MKKILILLAAMIMVLSLTACNKKCVTHVCSGKDCTDIEVPCESSSNDTTDTSSDTSSDTSEKPIENDDNISEEDNSETIPDSSLNTSSSSEINSSSSDSPPSTTDNTNVTDVPREIPDPGIDYSNYLDVEQAALNAFQAIIDGDYEGLMNMCYVTDSAFVSLQDIVTYFQISDYGNIKGKTIQIKDAKASNQGYSRLVIITYNDGSSQDDLEWEINMVLSDGKWKYFDENFLATDWTFKTSPGTVVTIDGKSVKPISDSSSTQSYSIPLISRVEHKITYKYKGQTKTVSIVPKKDVADMYYD